MLKVMKIQSANGVEKYLTEGKEHYYKEGLEKNGSWLGGESFGFSGDIKLGDLKNLLEGRNSDGDLLIKQLENRQVGWDCTFSAPKSVSIVWAFSDAAQRKLIEDAQDRAVEKAVDYLKTYALDQAVRRGKGGLERESVKEIPVAVYKHYTSRENDMQIHSHVILPNLALRHDGTVGGIQPDHVFKRMQEIGAIYQAELGQNLKGLGYTIENAKNSIRISDVPLKMEELFSKRSKIISDIVKEEKAITGKHKDAIKTISRKDKTHTDPETVKEKWYKEFKDNGYKLEHIRELNKKEIDLRDQLSEKDKIDLKEKIIEKFVDNMSNTRSTFHEFDLRREIAAQSRSYFGSKEIIEIIEKAKSSPELFQLSETKYTTRSILEIEENLKESISYLNGFPTHSCSEESIYRSLLIREDAKVLSEEQINMVKHVTEEGSIKVVEGLPGTGKSFALSRACEVFQENGYNVRGLAPTGKAAENLEDLNIKSTTVDKFLYDEKRDQDSFDKNDVILVDEAAMIGSKKTSELIQFAKESGAKIILVGDSKQLQPIDAGGAFRMIKDMVGCAELQDIRRQNQEWYREAIHDIRNGKVEKALLSYLDHGMIKISSNQEEMIQNITDKYILEMRENPKQSQLILCGTNYQVQKINSSVRDCLKEEGKIQKDKSCLVEVKDRLNHKVEKEFCVKDRVYFLQNSTKINVKNGSIGQIEKITRDKKNDVTFDVKLDNGKKIKVNTSEYQKIDHGYACTVHKSQGTTVDKVYVAIDKMDNEMSGVALSRHRDSATIYTNKENHEGLFKTHESQKEKNINISDDFKVAIDSLNKSMTRSNQKDTTQDDIKQEYVTDLHLSKIKELESAKEIPNKYEILKDISTMNLGVKNPFLEPQNGISQIHREAAKIIQNGNFKKEEIDQFCKLVKEYPLGQRSIFKIPEFVEERSKKFGHVFNKMEEKIKIQFNQKEKEMIKNQIPTKENKIEDKKEFKQTYERVRSKGFSMGR